MKKIFRVLIGLIMIATFAEFGYAQPPVYQMMSAFNIDLSPDTLRQYHLLDINHDSISDLICSTLDSLWAFNGTTEIGRAHV
jgi:hypothetical protein